MRYSVLLASVILLPALLLSSCFKKSEEPESPGTSGFEGEVVFLEKPLEYWVGQAKSEEPTEKAERIVEALGLALDSDDDDVVVAAADGLEVLGPKSGVTAPKLASKLNHIQPWLRCACMDALQAIGPDSVPSLIDLVQSGPGGAPVRALIVLGNMGPAAKDAVPALEKALEDSPNLSDRITKVLAQIDPERAAAKETGTEGSGSEATVEVAAESVPAGDAATEDWPGFHGPFRDAICRETGLLQKWPKEGPPLLWKLEGLGMGYSTVSIVGDRFYTMGDRIPAGKEEKEHGEEFEAP